MNGFWEDEHLLRTENVDFSEAWRFSDIFLTMQEAGAAHCERNGLGVYAMRAQNLAWVVARAHVRMQTLPKIGQTVRVVTWPKPPKHSFFPRFYQFEADGQVLGSASTLYVQLDLTERKMVKPWLGNNDTLDCDSKPSLSLPGNLPVLQSPVQTLSRAVCYSDIDLNRHVNNARYADWFCDCLPMEHHRDWQLKEVLIHYDRELVPGETASLALQQEGTLSLLRGRCNGEPCFAMSAVWEPRLSAAE